MLGVDIIAEKSILISEFMVERKEGVGREVRIRLAAKVEGWRYGGRDCRGILEGRREVISSYFLRFRRSPIS